ncbi:MAG: molybdate ABC transporter substrate-binding protein [Alphaproteobacteria bacterium]|nr:molybdate ABC transporter substrate-binding protein [Alphaproteobacteria bacterium]
MVRTSQIRRAALRLGVATLTIALVGAVEASAGTVRVAVATNFLAPLRALEPDFAAVTGHTLRISAGATGQLFAQIGQGAPYDVFLAADQARPIQAVENGWALAETRFTYAHGRLALLSGLANRQATPEELTKSQSEKVALADPRLAPYGRAAAQVIARLGLTEALGPRLVRGKTAAQAFQFTRSGAAAFGFVALSQIRAIGEAPIDPNRYWIAPEDHHAPIAQDAVLLAGAVDKQAALAFLDFLKSDEAKRVLRRFGYSVGEE